MGRHPRTTCVLPGLAYPPGGRLLPGVGFRSLGRCLQLLLGSAVTAYIPRSTASLGPHRHLIAWWVVFSMLMATAFSSGLISHLTLPRSEAPIDSAQDIVAHRLAWASSYVPNVHVILDLEVRSRNQDKTNEKKEATAGI